MNWFKRANNRQEARPFLPPGKDEPGSPEMHSRRETDPATCLEVYQNHWKQAWMVIEDQNGLLKDRYSMDEVETVMHNFEQMMTLLAGEESYDDDNQQRPGPILVLVIKDNTFEKFSEWCRQIHDLEEKLICEQLKIFYHLIAHSEQLLLVHKAIVHPLMKLLSSCTEYLKSKEVEELLAQMLHQICLCISQQTSTLETFFSTNGGKVPAECLIFSLILYIHRDGRVGQQAREALLLIMTLSNKYPHIGRYISDYSHLCPVLATGLSGLFSSLPRKITITNDDWYCLTLEDCRDIPDLMLFLNSLEFCNAVLQIAHPLVRDQLVKYIYNGFLVPVLGAALHQNSREEVITATAYLDLFIRRITEPTLIKAFLRFILSEKYDEIVILESLITRINSNSKLSLVSLSLFKTLVELNCEDVMFQLVFKYLIPCTHVMVSQKRAVKDVDFHSKSAEKFLSLRPECCQKWNQAKDNTDEVTFSRSSSLNESQPPTPPTCNNTTNNWSEVETDYMEYLYDAYINLKSCCDGCQCWSVPYDGDKPSPISMMSLNILTPKKSFVETANTPDAKTEVSGGSEQQEKVTDKSLKFLSHGNTKSSVRVTPDKDLLLQQTHQSLACSKAGLVGNLETNNARSSHHEENNTNAETDDGGKDKCPNASSNGITQPSAQRTAPDKMHQNLSESVGNLDPKTASTPESPQPLHQPFSADDSCSAEPSLSVLTPNQLSNLHANCDDMESFLKFLDRVETGVGENDKNEDIFMFIDNLFSGPTGLPYQYGPYSSPNQVKSVHHKADSMQSSCTELLAENSVDAIPSATAAHEMSSSTEINKKYNEKSSEDNLLNQSTNDLPSSVPVTQDSVVDRQMNGLHEDTMTGSKTSTERQQNSHLSFDQSSLQSLCNTKQKFASKKRINSDPTAANSPTGLNAQNKHLTGTPNIGPFLSALLSKLESMVQNSLHVNFLLTGLISRLATYPQPLLRSFLLNHNLVFQPSIKSLIQVLSSVRHKVDHYSHAIPDFSMLVVKARQTLNLRICLHHNEPDGKTLVNRKSASPGLQLKSKSVEYASNSHKGVGRKHSFFLPAAVKPGQLFTKVSLQDRSTRPSTLESMPGGRGYRYINQQSPNEHFEVNPMENTRTRNAVHCAIVLEEFLKELAALSQEHSVLLWGTCA
ncbi:FTS and Hook-interacting protein-like isoform X2 [Argonauta hians]